MKNFLSGTTPHMFIIGIFMLLLLIPLSMVQDLVNERQRTEIQTVEEVRRDWAYTQYVGGPVLVFPYTSLNSDGVKVIRYLNASPDTMNVEGVLNPDILYRSIYEIPVYRCEATFSGKFTIPDLQSQGIAESSILWDQVFVSFFISDLKGISEETRIVWDDDTMVFKAGAGRAGTFSSGLHTSVPIKSEDIVTKRSFSYKVDLKLKGSASFFVVPIGKQTSVSLSSSWSSPKFTGTFLPETRTVTDEGFKATWKVLSYNRDFPDVWSGSINNELYRNIIGTELFMEINTYSKTDRTVKYGFLFILFTFIVFFFAEVFSKIRIHPIHYTLVGISLVIFYILLLSFAEHMNFNLAYLIAMLATSGLISFYSFSIYRKKIVGFITTFELLLLYGFVFVILHMYEYALLAGSVGVFVILSIVMFFSRSINWYSVFKAPELDS